MIKVNRIPHGCKNSNHNLFRIFAIIDCDCVGIGTTVVGDRIVVVIGRGSSQGGSYE